jgi:uncharacterized protein YciI
MFVVLLTYVVSLDRVDDHLPAHREYLSSNYAAGVFLLSGRREPRNGGVILARAESRQALEAVLARDPFRIHGVADYQIVEFAPTMAAPSLGFLVAT